MRTFGLPFGVLFVSVGLTMGWWAPAGTPYVWYFVAPMFLSCLGTSILCQWWFSQRSRA